ncbi:MAG: efflux transporter outer membrane subunit [Nitrospirae bacterium]|nr:efflux transporter outer membrane subunit [Nitrospirota bacterium]
MNTIIKKITAVFMMLALSGCVTVGPDYVSLKISAPEKWNAGTDIKSGDAETLEKWWSTLNDPKLTSLIERSASSNLGIREAKARVREARARRGISSAGLFPTIDASGSAQRGRGSSGTENDFYSTGFDAGWELDIFGGLRRSVEAADADLEASEEGLRDVLVSLLAEVSLNYVDVRLFQARIAIAESNLAAQTETYQIAGWRNEAGLTSRLDVEEAMYSLEKTRSQIPALRSGLDEAMNRIAILLGENPGAMNEELSEYITNPVTPLEIAVGLPADLLRRRPDVRKAERRLAAQTARIGVATAGLYPQFTLSGSIGLEALELDNLFSYGNRTFGIGPGFKWNIFDAGSIRKNIEAQDALQEQALIQYETAVLEALHEVDNALTAYAGEQVRRQSLINGSNAAGRAVKLAQDQYASGLIDFQALLTAQQSLLSLQDQLAGSDAEVISNLIRLYKALGGGWESLPIKAEDEGDT